MVTVRVYPTSPGKRNDLVIDVGFHRGGDARFYLDKGFCCDAVEVNPFLVCEAWTAFAEELADGGLRIFGLAIAEQSETVPLAVATEEMNWSSLYPGFLERNANLSGTYNRTADVPGIRFEDVLAEVGIPRYLKVDAEGLDVLCIRALRVFDERPDPVSPESVVSNLNVPFEKAFEELAELWSLGYRRLAYVDQSTNPFRPAPNPDRDGHLRRYAADLETQWIFRRRDGWAVGINLTHIAARRGATHPSQPRWLRRSMDAQTADTPYAWLTKTASHLRRPVRRDKGHSWYDLHARLDRSHRSAAPGLPI